MPLYDVIAPIKAGKQDKRAGDQLELGAADAAALVKDGFLRPAAADADGKAAKQAQGKQAK